MQNLLNIVTEAQTFRGDIDYVAVIRNVMRTQPPRFEVIPDMSEYIRKWGGVPSGRFIKDFAAALAHTGPAGRIISGNFFKMLANLKFPHDEIPSHLVNAILYVHACHEEHQDGFARYITRRDLALIEGKKNERRLWKRMAY